MADTRREDLERVLAGLWAAFDGDRKIITGTDRDTGEPILKDEAAAPLANALVKVIESIAALPVADDGSRVDEIKRKRDARRGKSAGNPPSAGRRGQPRRSAGVHRTG